MKQPLKTRVFTTGQIKKSGGNVPKIDEHEWEARIANRSRNGCPFCSGQRKAISKSQMNLPFE